MADVLAPIEQALVALLRDACRVPVSTRVPPARPAAFIRLSRTGGAELNRAQSTVTVLIECWANDQSDAWLVCADALTLLRSHRDGAEYGGVQICTAACTEPVNYPDGATGTPRYQFIYSPTVITEGASL